MLVSEGIAALRAPALPTVSILIAARNEEAVILDCLRAVAQLDYPESHVEVLIGNDQSTDRTGPLTADFIADKPTIQLIDIAESGTGLRGKANVLAQLAHRARGEWLFFTDADTQVPTTWLREMIQPPGNAVGIVTGITLPRVDSPGVDSPGVDSSGGSRLFGNLQTIDWLYSLTLTHWLGALGIPVTAMGNNMAVRREAYQAVGGYEKLPFSVTEDYALFRAVVASGYGFRTLLDERVLATTRPAATLLDWLDQRKRWMRGASQLPLWLVTLLYAQYLTLPLLVLLAWFWPVGAVLLYIGRLLVQATVLSFGLARLRRPSLWPFALLFEPYQLLLGPLAVAFYWFSGPVRWKGRQFK